MIQYLTGNLLESSAQALVNTVNTVGVMGKGIALQFKTQFPVNYKEYVKQCQSDSFHTGQLLITKDSSLLYGEKMIINFPTKTDWRKPSEYEYIESGLKTLVAVIHEQKINSIAIPPLGAGNGGLDWIRVKALVEKYLSDIDCLIFVYEPNIEMKEVLRKERVPLTPARAMLLAVMYDLVRNEEFVSEFAAEKICYFLQRLGAASIFKLTFQPHIYGPYSGKVRHILYYLNGSYIKGISDKDNKPFEILNLLMETETEVLQFLQKEKYAKEWEIVQKTKALLKGFYNNFNLKLLSTLDFIIQTDGAKDLVSIKDKLNNWSNRKSQLFSNETFLIKGINQLTMAKLL